MSRFPVFFAAALAAGLALAGCSPAFNWREVRPENTHLQVLLPCNPYSILLSNDALYRVTSPSAALHTL